MSDLVHYAISFAIDKHKGQKDDDGRDYIIHPMTVGALLMCVTNDQDIIAAGYLHDVLEDTDTSYLELKEAFGARVADLVYEVTHEGKKDEHGYYFPRLKSKDAILIKFADRLSNLSRMSSWDPARQEQYLRKSKFWRSE